MHSKQHYISVSKNPNFSAMDDIIITCQTTVFNVSYGCKNCEICESDILNHPKGNSKFNGSKYLILLTKYISIKND